MSPIRRRIPASIALAFVLGLGPGCSKDADPVDTQDTGTETSTPTTDTTDTDTTPTTTPTELPDPDSELWVDNVAGQPGATGAEDDPFPTIALALENLDGLTYIYVRDTGSSYEGACVWDSDVGIFGVDGRPVIDQYVTCDGRNVLLFSRGDDVRFDNFTVDASAFPGESVRALVFSGLPDAPMYRNVGNQIHGIGPGFGIPGRSLISSSLCYDCIFQNGSSTGAEEHGIYWTNHQDGSIIRNNTVSNADGACIQLNSDPETYDGGVGIEDGVMSGSLVENNVLIDCGTGNGGAALNLAGVHDSIFRNNLIYGTDFTGGIAQWDDGYSDWGDYGNFDFGCKDNQFLHNTIDCRDCDRHAMSFRNGSTGTVFQNNIVITDSRDALGVDVESDSGLQIDYNLYLDGTLFEDPDEDWIDPGEWQALGHDANAVFSSFDVIFSDASAGDYTLANGSPAIDAGADHGVLGDLGGDSRPAGAAPDIGAYEAQ